MRVIALFVLSIFVPAGLVAHGSDTLPAPGTFDVSLYWIPIGGKQLDLYWVENAEHTITKFGYHAILSRFNAGTPGLATFAELGLVPGWSLGAQVNFPQIFLSGLQGDNYHLDLSLFSSVDLLRYDRFGLQARAEVEATSLLRSSDNISMEDGYFNFYLTLGGFGKVLKSGADSLDLYLDIKAMTSLLNPALRNPISDFEGTLGLAPGSMTGVEAQFGPICRIAMAPGIEGTLGKWVLHAGFNATLIAFNRYYVTDLLFSENYKLDPTNFEFGWRYRL
jgi:hypothetical protein